MGEALISEFYFSIMFLSGCSEKATAIFQLRDNGGGTRRCDRWRGRETPENAAWIKVWVLEKCGSLGCGGGLGSKWGHGQVGVLGEVPGLSPFCPNPVLVSRLGKDGEKMFLFFPCKGAV